MTIDYTLDAVRRQLRAMNCPRVDVALIYEAEGPGGRIIWQRDLTPAAVMHRKAYYASQNAQGFGVFVQPAPALNRALILLDDVEDHGALFARGVDPCAVVETSQANFQAWLDLGEPMPPEHRAAVAKLLAREFDGDKAAAGNIHLGRLAGFQNRKPGHADGCGKGPWVYARHSQPGACPKAGAIRAWAARNARTPLYSAGTPDSDLAPTQTPQRSPEGKPGAAEAFARAVENARQHCERMAADPSLADYGAACALYRQGYTVADVQAAIEPTASRKRDPADYARRTAAAAWHRLEREREANRRALDWTP